MRLTREDTHWGVPLVESPGLRDSAKCNGGGWECQKVSVTNNRARNESVVIKAVVMKS